MRTAGRSKFLAIGLEAAEAEALAAAAPEAEVVTVADAEAFAAQLDSWQDGKFDAIVCGKTVLCPPPLEAAKALADHCPKTPKFFVTRESGGYEPRNLVKAGFARAFLLPLDLAAFKRAVLESVSAEDARRSYRPVRVFDVGAGSTLDFDTYVFLPLNRKYLRFSRAGEPVDERRMEKLNVKKMSLLFVDHKDLPKFYRYSAARLRELGDPSEIGATERQDKLREAVRGLFSDVFDASVKGDFETAKEMLEACSGIISNYVTRGASSDWYRRLTTAIGEAEDSYSHASNVATFAALFAIGCGHPRPEDLAMAGLFHDLGEASVPGDILAKPDSDRVGVEREIYWTHPEKTMNALKHKGVIVAPAVEAAIAQHHEAWDGQGAPKRLPAAKISEEAQLLSFADRFDYLTRIEPGRARVAPIEAFEEIKRTGAINPDLLEKLRALLAEERSCAAKAG